MLLFGHIGVTLGLALGAEKALRRRALFLSMSEQVRETAAALIDYRLVLLGSILPDIIDKPASFLLPVSGRIFGHSLLFFLIILLAGLYRYFRAGRSGILILSLCSGFHLILDQMWLEPRTLFWPLHGLTFPRYEMADWLANLIEALKSEPAVYWPEIVGILILMLFMLQLLRSRSLLSFLRNGIV